MIFTIDFADQHMQFSTTKFKVVSQSDMRCHNDFDVREDLLGCDLLGEEIKVVDNTIADEFGAYVLPFEKRQFVFFIDGLAFVGKNKTVDRTGVLVSEYLTEGEQELLKCDIWNNHRFMPNFSGWGTSGPRSSISSDTDWRISQDKILEYYAVRRKIIEHCKLERIKLAEGNTEKIDLAVKIYEDEIKSLFEEEIKVLKTIEEVLLKAKEEEENQDLSLFDINDPQDAWIFKRKQKTINEIDGQLRIIQDGLKFVEEQMLGITSESGDIENE